jgi:hypothetical protein
MSKWKNSVTAVVIIMAGLFITILWAELAHAQGRGMDRKANREVYRGNIFYIGGTRGASTDFFTLTIDSYTPDQEVQRMLGSLQNGGQDELRKQLGNPKRGTIQIGNRLSRDLQAVWVTQTDEGRKIFALAERWMGFGELRRGSRSVDYPFTYIELSLEDDKKIEGELFPASRVRAKKNMTLEVENFGIYPARLTNIKQTRK